VKVQVNDLGKVQVNDLDEIIDLEVIASEWKTLKTDIMTNSLGANWQKFNQIVTSNEYPSLSNIYNFIQGFFLPVLAGMGRAF